MIYYIRRNGCKPLVPSDFNNYSKTTKTDETKREGVLDLLGSPRLFLRLCLVSFSWTATTLVYYGLSLNAASLSGNVFLNFSLLALIEVPGYTLSYVGMTWAGRRLTMVGSLLVASASCLAAGLVVSPAPGVSAGLTLVGKLCATSAFSTIYLYTTELFPTTNR